MDFDDQNYSNCSKNKAGLIDHSHHSQCSSQDLYSSGACILSMFKAFVSVLTLLHHLVVKVLAPQPFLRLCPQPVTWLPTNLSFPLSSMSGWSFNACSYNLHFSAFCTYIFLSPFSRFKLIISNFFASNLEVTARFKSRRIVPSVWNETVPKTLLYLSI